MPIIQNMLTLEEEFKDTVRKRRFRHLKALKADIANAYQNEPVLVLVSSIFVICLLGVVAFEFGLITRLR